MDFQCLQQASSRFVHRLVQMPLLLIQLSPSNINIQVSVVTCLHYCRLNPITTEIPEMDIRYRYRKSFQPAKHYTGSAATLVLSNPVASSGFFMPPKNGKFQIPGNSVIYRYDYCETDSNSNTSTLHGIYDSDDPQSTDTFSVSTTTDIIPNDFFTIKSIGTYAGVSRTVTFITPVDFMDSSDSDTQKTTYSDTFDTNPGTSNSASNWHDSVFGSHAIATVSGGTKSGDTTANNALKVTGTYSYNSGTSFFSDDIFLSLIPLKWSQNYANFLASWQANEKDIKLRCTSQAQIAST